MIRYAALRWGHTCFVVSVFISSLHLLLIFPPTHIRLMVVVVVVVVVVTHTQTEKQTHTHTAHIDSHPPHLIVTGKQIGRAHV